MHDQNEGARGCVGCMTVDLELTALKGAVEEHCILLPAWHHSRPLHHLILHDRTCKNCQNGAS